MLSKNYIDTKKVQIYQRSKFKYTFYKKDILKYDLVITEL